MNTRVTTKGQIILPATLRKKYGIVAGTKIMIFDNGDSIMLKPITEKYLKKLQGSLKGLGSLRELQEEKRAGRQ